MQMGYFGNPLANDTGLNSHYQGLPRCGSLRSGTYAMEPLGMPTLEPVPSLEHPEHQGQDSANIAAATNDLKLSSTARAQMAA